MPLQSLTADGYGQWESLAQGRDQLASQNYWRAVEAARANAANNAAMVTQGMNRGANMLQYLGNLATAQNEQNWNRGRQISDDRWRQKVHSDNLDIANRELDARTLDRTRLSPRDRLAYIREAGEMVANGADPVQTASSMGLTKEEAKLLEPFSREFKMAVDQSKSLAQALNSSQNVREKHNAVIAATDPDELKKALGPSEYDSLIEEAKKAGKWTWGWENVPAFTDLKKHIGGQLNETLTRLDAIQKDAGRNGLTLGADGKWVSQYDDGKSTIDNLKALAKPDAGAGTATPSDAAPAPTGYVRDTRGNFVRPTPGRTYNDKNGLHHFEVKNGVAVRVAGQAPQYSPEELSRDLSSGRLFNPTRFDNLIGPPPPIPVDQSFTSTNALTALSPPAPAPQLAPPVRQPIPPMALTNLAPAVVQAQSPQSQMSFLARVIENMGINNSPINPDGSVSLLRPPSQSSFRNYQLAPNPWKAVREAWNSYTPQVPAPTPPLTNLEMYRRMGLPIE